MEQYSQGVHPFCDIKPGHAVRTRALRHRSNLILAFRGVLLLSALVAITGHHNYFKHRRVPHGDQCRIN
jgi:hypothetical protein